MSIDPVFNPVIQSKEVLSNVEVSKEDKISAIMAEGKRGRPGSSLGWNCFDLAKKKLFLEAARRFFPNITRCCHEVGISWQTFSNHRKQDKSFAEGLRLVELEVTDRIEGVMATEAVNPKSFLDRMAYLRAHRPELYDRAKVVKIEGYKMGDGEKAKRLGVIEGAIDAEIVKTYQTRKERREAKQQQQLQAGKESGGEQGGGERGA